MLLLLALHLGVVSRLGWGGLWSPRQGGRVCCPLSPISTGHMGTGAAKPFATRQASASAWVQPAGQAMLDPLDRMRGSLQVWQSQNKSTCVEFESARAATPCSGHSLA